MNDYSGLIYRAFDVAIKSTIELPELEPSTAQKVDIILTSMAGGGLNEDVNWFHHWYSDDLKTEIAISIARESGGYRLRFPTLADFILSPKGETVVCEPCVGVSSETIRHLFLDQVLPRILGQRGDLLLHAGSVEIGENSGIAFAGESGCGKSTLASSFQLENAQFIADDCLKLKVVDGSLIGVSAYCGSRLWEDSIEELYPAGVSSSPVSHYSSKRRVSQEHRKSSGETVLKAIFFLEDPQLSHTDEIQIESLPGADAIMKLIKRSFLLDVVNVDSAARQFDVIGKLIATGPLFFSLQYPRKYSRLKDVRQAIMSTVLSLESGRPAA